jgi:glycosyltransferase involved in cell wall biosynthesis
MRIAVIRQEASLRLLAELNARGHTATLLWPPPAQLDFPDEQQHFPRLSFLPAARWFADCMNAFDVLYFSEAHLAAEALRRRKYQPRLLPIIVLEEGPDELAHTPEAVHRASASAYAHRHADFTIAAEAPAWLQQAEALWQQRSAAPPRQARTTASAPGVTVSAVTVCIPYYEAAPFFPQALASLAAQTSRDFTVIAVDDGSVSAEARSVFQQCAALYAHRGWQFLQQANGGPGAARNRAALEATSEFLLFFDADDIAAPLMIERLLDAALLTGEDVLVLPNYGFAEDPNGPAQLLYQPTGYSPAESLGDDHHGGSCFLVQRKTFWSIGGFTEDRGVGFEDYEFHVRCTLKGLRWDVFPELHYRYRLPGPHNVSRSTAQYANQHRVLRHYESHLAPTGLQAMPLAYASAHWRHERAMQELRHQQGRLAGHQAERRAWRPAQRSEIRLLLFTCYFPYGMASGWHNRVQQMIRYFGSRYSLTLFTILDPETFVRHKKEALRWLEAIRAVYPSKWDRISHPVLPTRVLEYSTEARMEAVANFPTDQYHAAILDQVFLSEYRRHIQTKLVLTEHNIESRLYRQMAALDWKGPLTTSFEDAQRQAPLLENYENQVWRDYPLRAVVSEDDRQQMQQRVSTGRTVVAPNGADPEEWLPQVKMESATVLFPAHLGYFPNIEAAEFLLSEVWPLVLRKQPRARLILAGRSPSEALLAQAKRSPKVQLIANPESMTAVARRASIVVAPLRLGSGTRLKILEAMAWGLPIVSTALGAEGIDAVDGENILLRDTAEDFAEGIVQLLHDKALWQRLRHNGSALIRERYSWDQVWAPLEDGLLDLIL